MRSPPSQLRWNDLSFWKGPPVITLIYPGDHKFPKEASALIVKFFQEKKGWVCLGHEYKCTTVKTDKTFFVGSWHHAERDEYVLITLRVMVPNIAILKLEFDAPLASHSAHSRGYFLCHRVLSRARRKSGAASLPQGLIRRRYLLFQHKPAHLAFCSVDAGSAFQFAQLGKAIQMNS